MSRKLIELDADEFEELVWRLLKRDPSVRDVPERRGKAHAKDGGIDVDFTWCSTLGDSALERRGGVQCKAGKQGLSQGEAQTAVTRLRNKRDPLGVLLVAVATTVSPDALEWLRNCGPGDGFPREILIWEGAEVDELLARHQDLREKYLGVPMDSHYVLRRYEAAYRRDDFLPPIQHLSIHSLARDVLCRAYTRAEQHRKQLSLTDLLVSILEIDDPTVQSQLGAVLRDEPNQIAVRLSADVLSKTFPSATSGLAVSLSSAAASALRTAFVFRLFCCRQAIDWQSLLWGVMKQDEDATGGGSEWKKAGVDRQDGLARTLSQLFSPEERAIAERNDITFSERTVLFGEQESPAGPPEDAFGGFSVPAATTLTEPLEPEQPASDATMAPHGYSGFLDGRASVGRFSTSLRPGLLLVSLLGILLLLVLDRSRPRASALRRPPMPVASSAPNEVPTPREAVAASETLPPLGVVATESDSGTQGGSNEGAAGVPRFPRTESASRKPRRAEPSVTVSAEPAKRLPAQPAPAPTSVVKTPAIAGLGPTEARAAAGTDESDDARTEQAPTVVCWQQGAKEYHVDKTCKRLHAGSKRFDSLREARKRRLRPCRVCARPD